MNISGTFTLRPWQKQQATLLYHFTSAAYFQEYFEPRRPPKLPHVWPLKLLHLAVVN